MAYTSEQVKQIYRARMQALLGKLAKDKQDQLDKDREEQIKHDKFLGKLNAGAGLLNMGKDWQDRHIVNKLKETYGGLEETKFGVKPTKYQKEDISDRGWLPEGFLPGGKEPKLGKIGATVFPPIEETPDYKEFKADKVKALEAAEFEHWEKMEAAEVEHWEKIRKYDKAIETRQGMYHSGDKSRLKKEVASLKKQRKAEIDRMKTFRKNEELDVGVDVPDVDVPDEEVAGVEIPDVPGVEIPDVPDVPDVKVPDVDVSDVPGVEIPDVKVPDVEIPDVGVLETQSDMSAFSVQAMINKYKSDPGSFSGDKLDELKILAEQHQLDFSPDILSTEATLPPYRTLGSTEQVAPTQEVTDLDKALEDLEAGLIEGEIPDLPEGGAMTASTDWMSMETSDVDIPDVTPEAPTVPDAKPGLTGKVFDAGKTAFQLKNIGDVMANADATDEEKGVAGLQGTKLLADLSTKWAGQESASQIGGKAATQFIKGKGIKEGVKLTGKQAVGAGLGAVLGGYTMVKGAGEAGEAWQEEDYDEAILHGMGSVSGGLQAAGGGMMATGIGAPLGAVLFGIGAAGSVISSAGLFLEGLFGDKEEEKEEARPKFDASRYFDTIRSSRRY